MKTSILIFAAGVISLTAAAQNVTTNVDGDGNTVIVVVNNDEKIKKEKEEKDKKDKADKDKKEKEEKDKKDKADKDKKDKDNKGNNGNGGTGNNGTGNNGGGDGDNDNGTGGNGPGRDGIGPLAISDVNAVTAAGVYPNPATDVLTISSPGGVSSYVLMNMDGTEIERGPVNGSQTSIQVSNYPRGAYHVQLIGNNQQVVYKNRVVITD